jgi:glucosamine--fructose-6-phosphate aminotransferase (isomerizing)
MATLFKQLRQLLAYKIYFGRCPARVSGGALILFPCHLATLCCGLAGIITVKGAKDKVTEPDMAALRDLIARIEDHTYADCQTQGLNYKDLYLGGQACLEDLMEMARNMKTEAVFTWLFMQPTLRDDLDALAQRITTLVAKEEHLLRENMGSMDRKRVTVVSQAIEALKDIAWCLKVELSQNFTRVENLLPSPDLHKDAGVIRIFKGLNTVLNSIDRLEVRGRDSAGISLLFTLDESRFQELMDECEKSGFKNEIEARLDKEVLTNGGISIHEHAKGDGTGRVAVTVTYKIAAEIGSLGNNVRFLREQIKADGFLGALARYPHIYHTVSSHTRWASVGAITEANCHPVDNAEKGRPSGQKGIIHACLNGDIDNYQELFQALKESGIEIAAEITTDTKIIPLQIEKYIQQGSSVAEAFRQAVCDFEGSHAIAMHTDLAPGKFFLAQKGSGQAVFLGIADSHYMPTSEVYGFVEETPHYIKLDGEKVVEGKNGPIQGQIFILDQSKGGGIDGIAAQYYDGSPLKLTPDMINETEITSRDIDRQTFPHYFLKEISESPVSVEKTLENRWKIKGTKKDDDAAQYYIDLDRKTFPESIEAALQQGKIRRIFFVGQGTAGVAALACADILNYYLSDPRLVINALKASELSGFKIAENDRDDSMADCLVVAISQSGTTTDTNRTVDMVRARGAHTLAIVNRRDSDITFKVDGVIYTSQGRDIEMSVASTKAFYSQIVAGALLGLNIASLSGKRGAEFVSSEIRELLSIPDQMRKVLALKEQIGISAKRLAATKAYWAAVGSGPNKASADEIRIKLSELCYKTISSDFVEDKKHIDLSSEPLIIVCAAGTKGTVIGDIVKDTAIFKAHKATPIVIADEGETRFDKYAEDVFHVPAVSDHLAPILNTLVGHIWGYYAALAINEGSKFLHSFREDLKKSIDAYAKQGLDVYEVILEKDFREKIAAFYNRFRQKRHAKRLPTAIANASDLILLFKYLSGRLPVSDFEIDFNQKGTALNMLDALFERLGDSINLMSRPVDAIKHQAKTVTVGTSRISEKVEGILFDCLAQHSISISQLINRNIIVLKNLQAIISGIKGSILYRIEGLNLLGEPTDRTTIKVLRKEGVLNQLPSRVETDPTLKGTKRIIVRKGNVYIGKGRKDDRSILVIPVISTDPKTPNQIENLLLLNIAFKEEIPLEVKIKALGGKYEHIKNIVQENTYIWEDLLIEKVEVSELFGRSAEKIAEGIISLNAKSA